MTPGTIFFRFFRYLHTDMVVQQRT